MARELHDIAAHHLSGIALMAAAVDRQIDTDPETAKRSVQQIRTQSTAVLDDLRRLVGLMREDAEAPRSVASLAAIPELVEQRRAGGAPVELRTLACRRTAEPSAEGIGTLAQLAVYRIAQESLTNAATHAPGARDGGRDRRPSRRGAGAHRDQRARPARPRRLGRRVRPGRDAGAGRPARRHPAATGRRADGGWQVRVEVPRDLTGRGGRAAAADARKEAT